ncbi:MAG: S41 family peptidase [Chloroflexi bacterium]|nr:S41 family peptidase [Chloroflexota bacterium]MCC6893529.1 S41 family peptidase [Anaerolineae bacterium]
MTGIWERLKPVSISMAIVIVFGAGFFLGSQRNALLAQGDTTPPPGAEKSFEPFWQVYNMIQSSYLDRDTVDDSKLVDGAIKGMVDVLGDQFSGYMDPETYPLFNSDLSGEVEGIGAVVQTDEETNEISIANVLEGSPAEAAGLKSGDVFVKVEGEDVTQATQFDLVKLVRGKEGTTVNLTMRRGEELIDFSIIRAKIITPVVEYKTLEDGIGYIKLRSFDANAYQEVTNAMTELGGEDMNGLVLDLRGNPGGLLTSAIDIASVFMKDGTILVEDFGNDNEQTYTTNGKYVGYDVPLTILVDENSASASELIAGAMQDVGRATIVGVTTFGKGTVQTWQQLVNGGGIRLTIARWLTPNGHWIHGNGVTPDVIVEWPEENRDENNDPQLKAAVEALTDEVVATN